MTSAKEEKKIEEKGTSTEMEELKNQNLTLQYMSNLQQDSYYRLQKLQLLERMLAAQERIAENQEKLATHLEKQVELLESEEGSSKEND